MDAQHQIKFHVLKVNCVRNIDIAEKNKYVAPTNVIDNAARRELFHKMSWMLNLHLKNLKKQKVKKSQFLVRQRLGALHLAKYRAPKATYVVNTGIVVMTKSAVQTNATEKDVPPAQLHQQSLQKNLKKIQKKKVKKNLRRKLLLPYQVCII